MPGYSWYLVRNCKVRLASSSQVFLFGFLRIRLRPRPPLPPDETCRYKYLLTLAPTQLAYVQAPPVPGTSNSSSLPVASLPVVSSVSRRTRNSPKPGARPRTHATPLSSCPTSAKLPGRRLHLRDTGSSHLLASRLEPPGARPGSCQISLRRVASSRCSLVAKYF